MSEWNDGGEDNGRRGFGVWSNGWMGLEGQGPRGGLEEKIRGDKTGFPMSDKGKDESGLSFCSA